MTKSEFKQLKKGSKVVANKTMKDFWNSSAMELCSVGGKLDDLHVDSYFIRRAIGQGLPHEIIVESFSSNVGGDWQDPEPGIYATLKVGKLKDTAYLSYKEIKRVRN